jgi:hypothetical protein
MTNKLVIYSVFMFGILGTIAVAGALQAWVLKVLWNAVLPPLFGLPTITFWQSLASLLLFGLVVGIIKRTVKA